MPHNQKTFWNITHKSALFMDLLTFGIFNYISLCYLFIPDYVLLYFEFDYP